MTCSQLLSYLSPGQLQQRIRLTTFMSSPEMKDTAMHYIRVQLYLYQATQQPALSWQFQSAQEPLKHRARRVPPGPAPVLASEYQPPKPQAQGAPQQTSQAQVAAPPRQLAPPSKAHGQQTKHGMATEPPPQINKSAAPSAAPGQQLKQDVRPDVHPPTKQGVVAPG